MDTWFEFPFVKEVGLFVLAVYGAGLSTFNWLHAVRRERRTIEVRFSTVVPTYGSAVGPCHVKVEATNVGQRAVTITMLAFEVSGGARLFPMRTEAFPGFPNTALPIQLLDGQSARATLSYEEVAEALIRHGHSGRVSIAPVCEDTAGGNHRGNSLVVDIAKWSRM